VGVAAVSTGMDIDRKTRVSILRLGSPTGLPCFLMITAEWMERCRADAAGMPARVAPILSAQYRARGQGHWVRSRIFPDAVNGRSSIG